MISTGTIAAVASPPGRAPRAIIRLSGPETPQIIESLAGVPFERGTRKVRLALADLNVPAILLAYPAPNSYTGEHSAELALVGAPHTLQLLMDDLLAQEGVRLAGPGEFSLRAHLSGRLSLDEAEGVAALIAATDADEADAARRLLSGKAGADARAWVDRLANLLALVEAAVDFTDQEDVVPIPAPELQHELETLRNELAAQTSAPAAEAHPEGPLVVLAGAPNAGKTTLFNALLARERAVASSTPGSTRDAIIEPLHLPAGTVRLADLPGLDAVPEGPLAAHAQRHAKDAIAAAVLIIHCDPHARFADPLPAAAARVARVRTKADLAPPAESDETISVCALDGRNLSALREAIADAALGAADATPRRRRALAGATAAIADAIDFLKMNSSERAVDQPELVAGALREALDSLAELAGAVPPDEIIARVFASFCVGK